MTFINCRGYNKYYWYYNTIEAVMVLKKTNSHWETRVILAIHLILDILNFFFVFFIKLLKISAY